MAATTTTVYNKVGVVNSEEVPRRDDTSLWDVISLSQNDRLHEFMEIFYQVFLWALFSSLLVHSVAFIIAICRLRKHRIGRWIPLAIIIMGVISPLTGGAISSAAVAGVYRASDITMTPLYCLAWGVGQTFIVVVISFTRILATL